MPKQVVVLRVGAGVRRFQPHGQIAREISETYLKSFQDRAMLLLNVSGLLFRPLSENTLILTLTLTFTLIFTRSSTQTTQWRPPEVPHTFQKASVIIFHLFPVFQSVNSGLAATFQLSRAFKWCAACEDFYTIEVGGWKKHAAGRKVHTHWMSRAYTAHWAAPADKRKGTLRKLVAQWRA